MKGFYAAVLATSFLLPACATKGAALGRLQGDLAALPSPALCGTVTEVAIEDERRGVSDRPLRIPTMSARGQQDEARPELTEALRTAVREEVTRRVGQGAAGYEVQVRIMEGVQRFQASLTSESESVRWVTEVRLSGSRGSATAEQEVEYAVRSLDASREFTKRLFESALRYSVAGALDRAAKKLPAGTGCEPAAATPS
jgi:hypothetical protein